MIARNTDTFWFGEQIVKLVGYKENYVDCPMRREHAARINKADPMILDKMRGEHATKMARWNRRSPQPELQDAPYFRRHFKTRQFATFPALQDLATEYNLDLTYAKLSQWIGNPPDSPYAQNLNTEQKGPNNDCIPSAEFHTAD